MTTGSLWDYRRGDPGNLAKAKLNPVLEHLNGTVGGIVFRRMHGKQIVMSKPDMSGVKWSKAQQEHRKRFKQAVAYAQTAMAEPKVRARYEKVAARLDKRPFDLAVSDYFKGKNLLE